MTKYPKAINTPNITAQLNPTQNHQSNTKNQTTKQPKHKQNKPSN